MSHFILYKISNVTSTIGITFCTSFFYSLTIAAFDGRQISNILDNKYREIFCQVKILLKTLIKI